MSTFYLQIANLSICKCFWVSCRIINPQSANDGYSRSAI